jgi:hypothetical protein
MKISKLPLFAAILPLAATPFLVPAPVHADTYKIYDLGGTPGGHIIVGIDNLGQVVILNENGGLFNTYLTYNNGVLVNTTSTLPNLTYDNGVPCSPPAGFSVPPIGEDSVCNNGFTAFGSFDNPNGDPSGVYTGPVSSLTLIAGFGETSAKLNSLGDFAWTSGIVEENFEAIDLTTRATPEPGSLLLVGTGCFSLLCVLRRKLS